VNEESKRLERWSFRNELIGGDDSVKGFEVDATDGVAGTVSWASYQPGESYLILTRRRWLRATHYVVPASFVHEIDRDARKVALTLTVEEAQAVRHKDPLTPLDPAIVAAFAHGAPGVIDGGLIV
jgi:hypothetical protein